MIGDDCNKTVLLWSLLPAGTNAVGTILGIILVDRLGRRKLILSSVIGVIVTLLAFGLTGVTLFLFCLFLGAHVTLFSSSLRQESPSMGVGCVSCSILAWSWTCPLGHCWRNLPCQGYVLCVVPNFSLEHVSSHTFSKSARTWHVHCHCCKLAVQLCD